MTVNYNRLMGQQGPGTIFKLLARWKGSIIKSLYPEGIIYFACYALVSLVYRFGLEPSQRRTFEDVVIMCRNWSGMIPVTFILGFYVSVVFSRWQGFVMGIPWTDKTHFLLGYISSKHPRAVIYRRAIVRYVLCAQVLCLRAVSLQVKKRFPTIQHIVDSQLLSEEEAHKLVETEGMPNDTKHWLPMHWAVNILHKARRKGHIASDLLLDSAVKQINEIRGQHGDYLIYDAVNVPMAYSQLVALAVWAHFAVGIFAFQWLDNSQHPLLKDKEPQIDLYFPIFTTLQFICFVGWLRVAQSMLNPLGEGDDDLELNGVIDANFRKGLLLADDLYEDLPELKEDGFDDSPELPHTLASLPYAGKDMEHSVQDVLIPKEQAKLVSAAPSMESGLHSHHSNNSFGKGSIQAKLNRMQATIKRSLAGQAVAPEKKTSAASGASDGELAAAAALEAGRVGDTGRRGSWKRRKSSSDNHSRSDVRMETLAEDENEDYVTLHARDGPALLAQMAAEQAATEEAAADKAANDQAVSDQAASPPEPPK